MGVGISCKNGLNLHLGEMLTNYATNKFESRRKKKELDSDRKSKSETSLFTLVSTKSTEDVRREDQFDPRKRRSDHRLDEHQASQVIYLNLPNNENLFIEKLNCSICEKQFLDEDGEKELIDDQKAVKGRLKTILDQAMINKLNEDPNEEPLDDIDAENCSIKTIINTSLTELDEQNNIDQIDAREDNAENFKFNNELKRLSSIEEESHQEECLDDSIKNKLPTKSSVKVQMSSLNVPSPQNEHNYSPRSIRKAKLKQHQNLRFKSEQEQIKDESSSDEQLKGVDLEEKQQMVSEMTEKAKLEPFRLENYSFSNSFNEQDSDVLPRSFSADYILDYIRDLNELELQQQTSFDLIKNTKTKLMHLSESDLTKLRAFDSESTISTENLNLDLIDKELLDRDQLDSVILDSNDDYSQQDLVGKNNRMNKLAFDYKSKINNNLKGSLPRLLTDTYMLSMLCNKKSIRNKLVTKTNRKVNLNKRSLVNSWLTNTKDQRLSYDQDNQFSSLWNNNQQLSPKSDHLINQEFLNLNSDNQLQSCFDTDCKLCRLNEEQINELDSDVLQLMNILKTLDAILFEKERKLQQLADQVEQSPSHSNLCATNKQKLIRSKANLKKKVKMLKQRSSRLGISMMKSEQGKQLILFKDGNSTYQIEIGEGK